MAVALVGKIRYLNGKFKRGKKDKCDRRENTKLSDKGWKCSNNAYEGELVTAFIPLRDIIGFCFVKRKLFDIDFGLFRSFAAASKLIGKYFSFCGFWKFSLKCIFRLLTSRVCNKICIGMNLFLNGSYLWKIFLFHYST